MKTTKSIGPCKRWKHGLSSKGYGKTWHNGKTALIHRVTWESAFGPIPDGMLICHHCDNPACYRLSHLFVGTHADNHADRNRKGRQARYESHGRTHLAWDNVHMIRRMYHEQGLPQGVIGQKFGVDRRTIGRIVRNETWMAA